VAKKLHGEKLIDVLRHTKLIRPNTIKEITENTKIVFCLLTDTRYIAVTEVPSFEYDKIAKHYKGNANIEIVYFDLLLDPRPDPW